MTGRKLVKLYVYQQTSEETVVDTYTAQEFEDFIIVNIKGVVTDSELQDLADSFRQSNKQILLVPERMELEFYGIREEESGHHPIPKSTD